MTTNGKEQNGRRRPSPNKPSPNKPPPLSTQRKAFDQRVPICRKYVWGNCTKGARCKFRHELVFDDMKEILKFCHDYQNKQGCTRVGCTYLHSTSEEENLFLTTGQMPRALHDRYMVVQTERSTSSAQTSFAGMAPPLMFLPTPPPPPPPTPAPAPPLTPAPAPPLTPAPAPPPTPAPAPPPTPAPAPPPTTAPAPPPTTAPAPRPTPAPTPSPSSPSPSFPPVQLRPPLLPLTFSAVQAPPPLGPPPPFLLNQPPPQLPPLFDASRPPPPLPGPSKSAGTKRKRDTSDAGPSKARKPEQPIPADHSCEKCIQIESRTDSIKTKINKLEREEECQRILFKMRSEEYDKGKELLRTLLSVIHPELYRQFEEYIESGPRQVPDIFAQFNQNPLMMLMEYMLINRQDATSPSFCLDDTIIQALSIPRWSQHYRQTPSPDEIFTILDMLRNLNSAVPDGSQVLESRGLESTSERHRAITSITSNGLCRLTNGQKMEGSSSHHMNSGSSLSRHYPGVPGPSGVSNASSAAPAPRAFPQYHPGVPPPSSRPYFPRQYSPALPNAGASVPLNSPHTPGPALGRVRSPAPGPVPSSALSPVPGSAPGSAHCSVPGPASGHVPGPAPGSASGTVPGPTSLTAPGPGSLTAPGPTTPAGPSTPGALAPTKPANIQYNQYMMGRFPHPPHYYPPYQ